MRLLSLFLSLLFPLSFLNVWSAETSGSSNSLIPETRPDPFTPRASLIRFWRTHISNSLPVPEFLLSKASPLSAVESARLAQLATLNSLSTHLTAFCSQAGLFCIFIDQQQEQPDLQGHDANFAVYNSKSFGEYGSGRHGGADSFKNYSDGSNTPNDTFKKYSRTSNNRREGFTSYAKEANVANANFTSYAASATGGSGEFISYNDRVNVPNLQFASYSSGGSTHKLSFSSYAGETNSGKESFIGYGKSSQLGPNEFTSYSNNGNSIESSFTGYAESSHGSNDSFKGYGDSGNSPHNNFKSYGVNGKSAIDSFASYRDGANVGEDSFTAYAGKSDSGKVSFVNYGNTFNKGNDSFKDYGKGSTGKTTIAFKTYNMERSFKDYAKTGVTFADYRNESGGGGVRVKNWVEPGKFFRESMLKEGNVMPMPDIRDKMPKRSFLPRTISSKLPFSTSRVSQIREIFHAREGSTMERVIIDALEECERAPSKGETRQCVGSVEDIVDFAASVLGKNITARSTENTNGSTMQIMIGEVRGINGGNVTRSVSCHQSLYPYLLYYCHSVPKVRVYEADILDVDTKDKINRGVAICHLDTSAWGSGHGAFVALGSAPGQTEVCHWIFENDMTWTLMD